MFLRIILPLFLLLTGVHALWTAYFRPYEIHNDYDHTRRRNLRITAWSLIACAVLISVFFFLIGGL
jgi:hypothetical protein